MMVDRICLSANGDTDWALFGLKGVRVVEGENILRGGERGVVCRGGKDVMRRSRREDDVLL
jgi:hypothetical protein